MIRVAILGYGTIGTGVAKVLDENKETVKQNAGDNIEVKRILDLRDFPGDKNESKVTHDFSDILNDKEIDIVVETMGGVKPAFEFVKSALEAGKSVCTSNKALVADHGVELIRIAKEKGVKFYFEASVGGGIPILRPLTTCLVADKIQSIRGILNGTTNYILSKMTSEGASYEEVLKEAQSLGYAEADPTADVEGYDTCRKIAILTTLATGSFTDYNQIDTTGISSITATDISYAKKLKKRIRLLGYSRMEDDALYALVAPYMLGEDDPLYGVNDVFNAITVTGNMLGDVMFYGQGAGRDATASAVVTDIIEVVKRKDIPLDITFEDRGVKVAPAIEMSDRFFLRIKKEDEGALSSLNIEEKVDGVADGEIGAVSGYMKGSDLAAKLSDNFKPISVIRYS